MLGVEIKLHEFLISALVEGEPHVVAAVPPGNEIPLPAGWEADQVRLSVTALWKRIRASTGNRNAAAQDAVTDGAYLFTKLRIAR
jgi:hypothetical protein